MVVQKEWSPIEDCWSGAKYTIDNLTPSQLRDLEGMLEEVFADSVPTDTEVNDFLWFEADTIAEWFGFADFENLEKANNATDTVFTDEEGYVYTLEELVAIWTEYEEQTNENEESEYPNVYAFADDNGFTEI